MQDNISPEKAEMIGRLFLYAAAGVVIAQHRSTALRSYWNTERELIDRVLFTRDDRKDLANAIRRRRRERR